MADLVITAANVVHVSGGRTNGTAGATITAGQALYIDPADSNKLKLADANGSSPLFVFAGIALHGASTGQPIAYAGAGSLVTMGATLAVGTIYVLSATPGGVAPSTDLLAGWRTAIIGVALTAANLYILGYSSSVAVP